jgi:uncharacterized protein YkwD
VNGVPANTRPVSTLETEMRMCRRIEDQVALRGARAFGRCCAVVATLIGASAYAGDSPAADGAGTNAAPMATCGKDAAKFQSRSLQRVNEYRKSGYDCGSEGYFAPTRPLAWNTALQSAASGHSSDMATHNYFSHTGLDGSEPGDRITRAGYAWSTWGENIAAGYDTVREVVDGWMQSDGHCANIMNPQFRDMGMACAQSDTSDYGKYWTMDLATRR